MISENELLSLFLRLAPIEGVSRYERRIADEVIAILRADGIRVIEDGAATRVRGNAGNLLCFPPAFDQTAPGILLEAHLDTVRSTEQLKAIVKEDRVTSDGTTILGADNRMGLSILVHLLLHSLRTGEPHKNYLVAFTVCEETGLDGADALDLSPYHVSSAYVFDCSRRPGTYIRESVGLHTFVAEFIGKASHAGVAPEEGVSAIGMAAAGISRLQLGQVDPDTTVNIGKIRGGTAVNIVPDRVSIEGEVRSFFHERIRKELESLRRTLEENSGPSGHLEFSSASNFDPYVHRSESPAIVSLEEAIRAAGLELQPIRYMGGSDANVFNAKGLPAVNIGIGAQKPHSVDEFFLLEDLQKSFEVAHQLIQQTK